MDITAELYNLWNSPLGLAIIVILIVITIRRVRLERFNPKKFNASKAAIIFKLTSMTTKVISVRISQVRTKRHQGKLHKYILSPRIKNQIFMLEPGLYFVDQLYYEHLRKEPVVETYNASDWIHDQAFTVPTGAFYVNAGQIVYLGHIMFESKASISRAITKNFKLEYIKESNLSLYTDLLPAPQKADKPSIIEDIYKMVVSNPKKLGNMTRCDIESLSDVKKWFRKKHPMIPVIPIQSKYYLPGEKINLNDN